MSEGAGQGLIVLACLQDLSQARARWGAAADGFLTLFSCKAILRGIADLRTLELVSALAGDHDVRRTSHTRASRWDTRHSPTTTTHWERQPVLPPSAVARQPPGTFLGIGPSGTPVSYWLTPYWAEPFSRYVPVL